MSSKITILSVLMTIYPLLSSYFFNSAAAAIDTPQPFSTVDTSTSVVSIHAQFRIHHWLLEARDTDEAYFPLKKTFVNYDDMDHLS